MKTKQFILGLATFLFLSISTQTFAEKQERKVDQFSQVAFSISGNVYISIGKKFEVILEGNQAFLEKVITEVDGSTLKIKKERNNQWKSEKVDVYITMPELEGVIVSGSGKVITKNEIKASHFRTILSGSGTIAINELAANDIKATISGSGSILLNGKQCEKMNVVISGSGDVEAAELMADEAKVVISGSGNAEIFADKELNVVISGSGNVKYKGNPVIDAKSVGSGRIRAL